MTALAATLALAAVTATASADELASSEEEVRIIWNDLDFNGDLIQCDVTLLGSFHELTIDKITNSLVGHITSAAAANCSGFGEAIPLTETLPWHVTYLGFGGTLPEIDWVDVLLVGASFLINVDFLVDYDCLYTTTIANPAIGRINLEGGVATTLEADPDPTIPLTRRLAEGTSTCPATGTFSGAGTITGVEEEFIFVELV